MIFGLRPIDLIAVVAVFALVACVFVIGLLLWLHRGAKRSEHVRRRVGAEGPATPQGQRVVRLFHEGQEIETTLPGEGAPKKSMLAGIEETCHAAGINAPAPAVLLMAAAGAGGMFIACLAITQHLGAAVVGGGGLIFGAWTLIKMRADKQAAKFDDQFVEALGLCARSLRAGHTVSAGLGLAAEQSPEPVKSVFTEICQQQELGVSLEQSLRTAAASRTSADLKLFAASVGIQIRAGGNLAETTQRLAAVIRERIRLGRRVRVLIAESQMSKRVLLALPVLMFALLNVINPDYVRPMYDTENGQMLLTVCGAMMLIGSWLMNKLAVLKY